MRDPAGRLQLDGSRAVRTLCAPLDDRHFLRHPLARQLQDEGVLIPFEEIDERRVVSPRQPFVSYPFEWTHSQLLAAAKLTVQLLQRGASAGFELKDATAFNVLFDGLQPRFCDHLSFEPGLGPRWRPYGQYVRHFIAPLALSRHLGSPVAHAFRAHLDGMPPALARSALGSQRWLRRTGWALAEWGGSASPAAGTCAAPVKRPPHEGLARFLAWQLDGLAACRSRSAWAEYEVEREHYPAEALALKRGTVGRWLQALRPNWTVDLGSNQGEFSALALEAGARVICIDSDHDTLERLQQRFGSDRRVHPVYAALDDPSAGRGWRGQEFASLESRLAACADVTLALALIHHLLAGAGIPMDEVSALLHAISGSHLIVELVDPKDVRFTGLLDQRGRSSDPSQSLEGQRQALQRHFQLAQEVVLPGTARVLALLHRVEHRV